MNKFLVFLALATLSACGSGDHQGPIGNGSEDSAPDANGLGGPKLQVGAEAHNSGDDVVPARDDARDFAARFAAVREIVGEAAARRVVVSADTQAKPIYRLELSNGNRLEWYEVLSGIPVAVESGYSASGLRPELKLQKMSAAELHAALAPGVAVPTELVELDRREQEMAPIHRSLAAAADRYANLALGPLESTVGDPVQQAAPLSELDRQESVGKRQLGLTAEQCLSKSVACGANPAQMAWRIEQRDRTANASITRSDVLSVFGVGCTQTGLVTHRVRYRTWFSWTSWFTYDLSAGMWVEPWYLSTDLLDFDFEGRIYNFEAGDKASQCAAGPS